MRGFTIFAAAAFMAASAPAAAGATDFSIVNATGQPMSSVLIRRFGGGEWRPLAIAPGAGRRAAVKFSDSECAFDIQATLGGGETVVWSGVNLCGTSVVTLNRNASGLVWVDYD